MKKPRLLIVAVVLIASIAQPCVAQSPHAGDAEWAGIITASAVSVGLTAATAYLHFGTENDWTPAEEAVTYIPMFSAGIVSSFVTTIAVFDLFIKVPMHPALAGLVGFGAGALEGAIIGGTTFSSFFATATYFDPDFMNEADSIYEAGWTGITGGGLFGAMVGAIPGAIAGVLLAILAH